MNTAVCFRTERAVRFETRLQLRFIYLIGVGNGSEYRCTVHHGVSTCRIQSAQVRAKRIAIKNFFFINAMHRYIIGNVHILNQMIGFIVEVERNIFVSMIYYY